MRRTRAQLDAIVTGAMAERPLSAYEIAFAVSTETAPLRPPQVYRVLDRLMREGSVRRIELSRRYAFNIAADTLMLCCRECGTTSSASAPGVAAALERWAMAADFTISRLVLECDGLCDRCRPSAV